MLGDALTAAIGDLVIGLGLGVAALIFIAAIFWLEARDAPRALEESNPEYVDPWDSFPPKWSAPEAESDLGEAH